MSTEADSNTNQYGLKRSDLTASIRRDVRKRCHFCCVRCGSGIYQYHHFNPPFEHAQVHDAEGITLLCGTCHDQVTRKFVRNEEIEAGDLRRRSDPADAYIRKLAVREPFFVALGSLIKVGAGPVLSIDRHIILDARVGEFGVLEVFANFYDLNRRLVASIDRNELVVPHGNWDVRTEGGSLVVNRGQSDIALDLVVAPPFGVLIRSMKLAYGDASVVTNHRGHVIKSGTAAIEGKSDLLTLTEGAIRLNGGEILIEGRSAVIPTQRGTGHAVLTALERGNLAEAQARISDELSRSRS